MIRKVILVVTFLVFAGMVHAEEKAEPESPWFGNLLLGYLSTAGNTDTTSYNAKFGVGYKKNDWEHKFEASSIGADDGDVTTAESYQAGWRSAYNFTEHDFVFGSLDWRKDRFSGITEQISGALNYGRRVIDTTKHVLALGIGAGYRDSDRSDGTSSSNVIGRGSLLYNWIFTENSGFDQNLIVETGSDNTYIESVSAVRANLVGDLALILSYTIKHNTDVPPASENTDRLTAISVEYLF